MSETGDWPWTVARDVVSQIEQLLMQNFHADAEHVVAAALRKERESTVENAAMIVDGCARSHKRRAEKNRAAGDRMAERIEGDNASRLEGLAEDIRALTPRGE